MRRRLLRLGLRLADIVARSLPVGVAYALADLAGRAWYRLAPERRRLVAESLSRIAEATGRPAAGAPLRRMVKQSFVSHARYWLEFLRAPHYPEAALPRIVHVEEWDRWEPRLHNGMVVAVPHLGNFEPYGHVVAAAGLRGVAPVEETEPRELFEFVRARRASGKGGVDIIPLRRAFRPMLAALRRNDFVALVADRDLAGDGVPVTMFGHATTLPAGPATLALRTGKPLLMARVLRTAPERFSVRAELVEAPRSGNADADVAALTTALAASFERAIGEAPEQWWAAFQPFWTDQRRRVAEADASTAAESGT
jgi:KDO2-lipid IV(A) lauroyltransferase